MPSARWVVGVALALGCLPVLALSACGNSGSSGGSGSSGAGDGSANDDGTVDGPSGGDSGLDGTSDDGGSTGDASSDGFAGDSGSTTGDGAACTPGCPASVTCGRYKDCTGNVITCGMPCAKGQSCITSGGSQSCQTPSCAGKCGEIAVDSCGVAVNCGGCPTGEACVNNACVTQPPSDAGAQADGSCGTLSCNPYGSLNLCGTVSDTCGQTKSCACPTGQQCSGGVCAAPPPECTGDDGGAGDPCGSVANACGSGQVQCNACTGSNKCVGGTCTPCNPPTCGAAVCGTVNNGCGPAVSCGNCDTNDKCVGGACCTPLTCAEAQDAGMVTGCGSVNLGCGVSKGCSPCGTGEVCTSNACCTPLTCAQAVDAGMVTGCAPISLNCGVAQSCAPCPTGQACESNTCVTCTPKTCADYGNAGCNHADGCGKTLNCCGAGTTCNAGGLCCAPEDVVYQGTCCQPQCDPNQPAGPQQSCGTTIFCVGQN